MFRFVGKPSFSLKKESIIPRSSWLMTSHRYSSCILRKCLWSQIRKYSFSQLPRSHCYEWLLKMLLFSVDHPVLSLKTTGSEIRTVTGFPSAMAGFHFTDLTAFKADSFSPESVTPFKITASPGDPS